MTDIFDEVEEDLRAERAREFAKRYGGAALVGAVVALACVGGWELWQNHQQHVNGKIAVRYFNIVGTLGDPMQTATAPDPKAEAALDALAAKAPGTYRTLARLRAAALLVAGGKYGDAEAEYQRIADDGSADKLLRGLASLQWVELQLEHGDPATLRARLAPLAAEGSTWRPLAQEAEALLDMREHQNQKAKDILQALSKDPDAPEGVRSRASGLLARLNS